MIVLFGEKVTPNQAAKYLVWDRGALAEGYWLEGWGERDVLTQREIDAIDKAITRQIQRVRDFLGIHKLPGFE